MASIFPPAWTQLSKADQLSEWRAFLDQLDNGGAGYHRLYDVLMPLWIRGDVPYGAGSGAKVGNRSQSVAEDDRGWEILSLDVADELFGDPPF